MITLQQCEQWDQADELAAFKAKFDLPPNTIYLDGNSLGAMPRHAMERAQEVIAQEWRTDLINSWNKAGWWTLPVRLGDQMSPLIGAGQGETIVSDSTSVNLFKVLAAAVNLQKERHPEKKVILAERDSFPTDLYIIEGFNAFFGKDYRLELIDDPVDLQTAVNDETAVVVLSHVNYRTGYLHDMQATNRLVHEHNGLLIWDLCHSVGALPIELKDSESDFAIGCTYKYLNAGPGAPALLWVNPKLMGQISQPLSGWWGHKHPFAMSPSYEAANGIERFLCGTQPIVSLSLVACGVDVFLQTDLQAVRRKSLALTDLFIALVEQECAEFGLRLVTPRDHHYRGSHVSFAHEQGYAVVQALIARGVIGDYREPEVMRFGVTPLYLSFVDIWQAVQHIKAVLTDKEWDKPAYKTRSKVT